MILSRRTILAMLGATPWTASAAHAAPADAAPTLSKPCLPAVDRACAPLLALLPEAELAAGIADPAAERRCDDWSAAGDAALLAAIETARAALPACPEAQAPRLLLDAALATRAVRYGRNDPTAPTHRPYRITIYSGPAVATIAALALWQPVGSAAALDSWQAKLDALADALAGAADGVRADLAAGCAPPVGTGRAALAWMDGFVAAPAGPDHPLVRAMLARGVDPLARDGAATRATATLARRVQPAMALLRDTVAAATRAGRTEPGVWQQPGGDALHAANLARAGDTTLTPAEAAALAHDEAKRVAALLDRRLVARGYRTGALAERLSAAFAAHPGLVAADDDAGREALLAAARAKIAAAHEALPALVPPAQALTSPLAVLPLPALGPGEPGGSRYVPAIGEAPATLWLDVRSVYALPVPGVGPIAAGLGLPGLHLLADTAAGVPRARLAAAAQWPAMRDGWAAYAERLAAEAGLFAHDPWGDVARLSDELMRWARLVVDVGIHAERWPRARAEAEMLALTGAPQNAAIDRITALPGEAASAPLGLRRLLDLRTAARTKPHYDSKAFHAAVLTGGARPLAEVAATVG